MSDPRLHERLNQIPDKLLSREFLNSQGLGNEIGFWIFDYPAEQELSVREYIEFLERMLTQKHGHLKWVNINLLSCVVDYLADRRLLDKAISMQQNKGNEALWNALKGPLDTNKIAPYLTEKYAANDQDIIFITGVGSVWPLVRAHSLLNSLHALLGHKPVVLFYPGEYSGQVMSLFGKIPSNNYYRAFRLAP